MRVDEVVESRCKNICKNLCLIDCFVSYIATRSIFIPYTKELQTCTTKILIPN